MKDWSWIERWDPFALSRREQLMAATTIAAIIVFFGLILDVPSAKRVKALEAEQHVVEAEIEVLKSELSRLSISQPQEASGDGQQAIISRTDARFSVLMRDLITIAVGVEVLAIRPAAQASGDATTLSVELKAPFRVLGLYLDALDHSGWMLTVNDLHVQSDPERPSSVSARFTLVTPLLAARGTP